MIKIPETEYPEGMLATDLAIAKTLIYTGFVCYALEQAFLGKVPSKPEAELGGSYDAIDDPQDPDPKVACPIYHDGLCGNSKKRCKPAIELRLYGPGLNFSR